MTQDPWKAASANATPADNAGDGGQESGLQGAYAPEEGTSQLFGGGPSSPSLLNKTHGKGTKRKGRITKVHDVQQRNFDTKQPVFWQPGEKKPVENPVNPNTGKPNNPVMTTVFELETEYRMDAAERSVMERDDAWEDDGSRVFYAGGRDLKVTREALGKVAGPLAIRGPADLIGKFIEVERTGKIPNPTGNPSWIIAVTFSAE